MGKKNLDVADLKKRVEEAEARMEEVNDAIAKKMTRKIMSEQGIESYKQFKEWYETVTFHAMLYGTLKKEWRENYEAGYLKHVAEQEAAEAEAKRKAKAERAAKRAEREAKKRSSEPTGERSNADSVTENVSEAT